MRDELRTEEFRRNPELEAVLAALNSELERLGDDAGGPAAPALPPVLVVGCGRSGTTLALQWLAASGRFTYASNLISRFAAAPWIGARVERLLADPACACGHEMDGIDRQATLWFRSRLGKTRGLLAPHEFWYFWRRFFRTSDSHQVDEATWDVSRGERFARDLARWEAVTGRPLAMKAAILSWNLPLLASLVPRAIFLHVRREPLPNLQSMLLARRAYFGRDGDWYSFRPPEYRDLALLPVPDQLAGQLWHHDRAIIRGLAGLATARRLTVAYEDLCRRPARVHERLRERMTILGGPDLGVYEGPTSFPVSGARRLPAAEADALAAAWSRCSGEPAPAWPDDDTATGGGCPADPVQREVAV